MALMRISLLGPNSNGTLAFGYVGLTVDILSVTVALLLLICTVADLVKKEKRSPPALVWHTCFLVFATLPKITTLFAMRYLPKSLLSGL